MVAVANEIAWRQAARRWEPIPVHKPSELSGLADALSRLSVPIRGQSGNPSRQLCNMLHKTQRPIPEALWYTWVPVFSKPSKPRHNLRKGGTHHDVSPPSQTHTPTKPHRPAKGLHHMQTGASLLFREVRIPSSFDQSGSGPGPIA